MNIEKLVEKTLEALMYEDGYYGWTLRGTTEGPWDMAEAVVKALTEAKLINQKEAE